MAAFALLIGLSFVAGFAVGMGVELANLSSRERQLARGRRLLAGHARGFRHQQACFYRLLDAGAGGQELPEPALDRDEHSR